MVIQTLKKMLALCVLVSFVACGPTLIDNKLSIALIDQPYSETFSVEDLSWGTDEILFDWIDGDLPEGIAISSDGEIMGTPTEFGIFEFEVRVYAIDEGWSWDYSDDYVYYDDAWFTLFVTEPSTNVNCPWPDDENVTETYICIGTPETTTWEQDESVPIDINYQVNFENASDYRINFLDFTIFYDSSLFAFDENELNSQSLCEVATEAQASVTFDSSTPGELRVIISAPDDDNPIDYSGTLVYLSLYALQNIEAGTYDLFVTLNSAVSSSTGVILPNSIGIDGSVTVDESITTEESTSP